MAEGLACPAADDAGWVRRRIDHLLVGAGIEMLEAAVLPRVGGDDLRPSGHDGLVVRRSSSP